MSGKPSIAFAKHRHLICRVVERHNVQNPRIFGSVPRGEDVEGSDLDLLVDALERTTLFDIAAIELELEQMLKVPVHVVTSGSLTGGLRARVLAQAEPV